MNISAGYPEYKRIRCNLGKFSHLLSVSGGVTSSDTMHVYSKPCMATIYCATRKQPGEPAPKTAENVWLQVSKRAE